MPEEGRPEALEVNGRVLESLPNALFRVELETERRQQITAHVARVVGPAEDPARGVGGGRADGLRPGPGPDRPAPELGL